jgi:hypothetical protein
MGWNRIANPSLEGAILVTALIKCSKKLLDHSFLEFLSGIDPLLLQDSERWAFDLLSELIDHDTICHQSSSKDL